jgi:putative transposase
VPKKSFTDEQIVVALRQAESGVPIVEGCRKFGVTETTFFRF